ncbi:hypothetical protein ACHHYP_03121 [Achlya hypogyna]|uniref:TAFII55 protein conserved region domain-containing protein n=1 Tax=Achlya hypogyna TaxID=1202772 RepID=A0A1V9Z4J0_ACHHY|nr:hypothetical protein ACHHYP_03121 [Achlya hypogyna]
MMEQYLIRVPKKIGVELRKKIHDKDIKGVDMVAGADNKHFKFHLDGAEYPVTLNQMPCILETHKTYDDNLFYKSGEIGQARAISQKMKPYEDVVELPSGITPPTTNIVKRKYSKTKKYPNFPKPDVARVEDSLVKIMSGGVIEDVQEELVDYYDWMVTEDQPNGIVVHDEMALILEHPEYLELSKKKEGDNDTAAAGGGPSGAARILEIEDTRTPADVLSEEDDEDDEGKSKPATAASTPTNGGGKSVEDDDEFERMLNEEMDADDDEEDKYNIQNDPEYQALVRLRAHQQKQLSDLEKEIVTTQASVQSAPNFVLKKRFEEKGAALQQQKAQLQDTLNETNQSIADLEAKAAA